MCLMCELKIGFGLYIGEKADAIYIMGFIPKRARTERLNKYRI